jgi:hypothetical protein
MMLHETTPQPAPTSESSYSRLLLPSACKFVTSCRYWLHQSSYCFQLFNRTSFQSVPYFSTFYIIVSVTTSGSNLSIVAYIIGTGIAQAVQCLTTGWTTGRSGFDPRQGQRIFPLSSVSRPALGPTQAPVQWVPVVFSPGIKRGRGVTLTTPPPDPRS